MKSFYYESLITNPYHNLAIESHFIDYVSEHQDTFILYFWINDNTVVIGKHQDAQAECNLELMKKDKIHLVRRKTGGGAVYHDVNNLNFSFIVPKQIFNKQKSMEIIRNALLNLGINAEISGRNDILVQGKKISGNAYFYNTNTSLHHGTILIDTDFSKMGKYLQVDNSKLKNNGVKSVKSRVINIKKIDSSIRTEEIKTSIKQSFEKHYNLKCEEFTITPETETVIQNKKKDFLNKKQILGKFIHWEKEIKNRFSWGSCTVKASTLHNTTTIYKIFSDCLDVNFIEKAEQFLNEEITTKEFNSHQLTMLNDIFNMLQENH